jgi:DNA-binding NarL/FixJ family response regulator
MQEHASAAQVAGKNGEASAEGAAAATDTVKQASKAMRIILADDHDLIRDTLEVYLQRLDTKVDVLHAATLAQALDAAKGATDASLVLLDLRMPGMNGLAGFRAMQKELPTTPIVIFSGDTNPDLIKASLQAGAAGFIPKTMRAPAMINALRLVLSGERYVPDLAMMQGDGKPGGANLDSGGAFSQLTPREREVLGLLVKGNSNKQIARQLKIEEITVALHLRSIYRKLNVASRTQAVRLALQLGWEE